LWKTLAPTERNELASSGEGAMEFSSAGRARQRGRYVSKGKHGNSAPRYGGRSGGLRQQFSAGANEWYEPGLGPTPCPPEPSAGARVAGRKPARRSTVATGWRAEFPCSCGRQTN